LTELGDIWLRSPVRLGGGIEGTRDKLVKTAHLSLDCHSNIIAAKKSAQAEFAAREFVVFLRFPKSTRLGS
jgi:hypothetical protein